MKFFNWMLRKSHQSTDYSLVSYNNDVSCVESGAKALQWDAENLLNQMLDGFLTIGTLGNSNPLLLSPIQEEDQNAAANAAAQLEYEAQDNSDVGAQDEQIALRVEKFVQVTAIKQQMQITTQLIEVDTIQMSPLEEHQRPSTEIVEPLLIKAPDPVQRTTLADLLAEEAENISSPKALAKKKRSSVPAKTVKNVLFNEEYSATLRLPAITKKVHRLMTKMLKKKIHPDLDQVKSRATDDEKQGRFLPMAIGANVSCSCYGATGDFSTFKRDPHGSEIVGTVI